MSEKWKITSVPNWAEAEREAKQAAEYQKLMEECFIEERKLYRKLFWKAARLAFVERCKCCDWQINRVQRWLYTVKALICMAIGLKWNCQKHGDYPETVEVCVVNYQKLYAGWENDVLEVGHDQWFYRIQHDSDWNM